MGRGVVADFFFYSCHRAQHRFLWRFHAVYRSIEARHFDHGFGAFTTICDLVFGMIHMPGRNEWPDVDLAEITSRGPCATG